MRFLLVLALGVALLGVGTPTGQAAVPSWQNIDPPGVSDDPNNPPNNFGFASIAVDPQVPTTVYLGTNYQGLYKSLNSGGAWTKIDTGSGSSLVDEGRTWTLAVASTQVLYTASGYGAGGVLKSNDGGVSWVDVFSASPTALQIHTNDISTIRLDPNNSNHLLASFHYYWHDNQSSGIVESQDGGGTWTAHDPAGAWGPGNYVWFGNNSSTWFVASQSAGWWITRDSGATWTQFTTASASHGGSDGFFKDGVSNYVVITGTNMLRSTDNGVTWADDSTGLPYAFYASILSDGTNLYTAPGFPSLGDLGQAHGPWYTEPVNAPNTWHGYNSQQTCDPSAGYCNGPASGAYDKINGIVYSANGNGGVWKLQVGGTGATAVPTATHTPTPSATATATATLVPTVAPTATATPPPIPAGLHVLGNQILDGSGQVVHLRGADRSGSEYMCLGSSQTFDGPSDQASISAMRAWQINAVRVPLNEDCWLGINGQPQQMTAAAYQTSIVTFVGLLNQNGITAILDLQWAAPGTTVSNGLTPMPDADHAPSFWASVAIAFKGNQSVIFDLFNEPYPDGNADTTAAWTCLRDGGTCPGVGYQAAGTQALVNSIRATGATNIIGVPGVQYTDVLSQWMAFKPNDSTGQLVALWHSYAGQVCSSQSCWDSQIKPVAASVPLIATEIGENDCQGVYIGPEMAWLDTNAGGNYLAWAWNTYDCGGGNPSLISSYDGTPTSYGIGLRNHLLELAGVATPTPVPVQFFNNGQLPFGLAVGAGSPYTDPSGIVYYPDTPSTGLTVDNRFFTPYTPTDGPYTSGRQGAFGNWTINVPNGSYVVTLGAAETSSAGLGEFGQDQTVQGQKVGTCIWTSHSGPPDGCPGNQTIPPPTIDQANTVSYTVAVFNQQLTIQSAASFGGGRTTALSVIRIDQVGAVTPTPTPVTIATGTPTPAPVEKACNVTLFTDGHLIGTCQ